MAGGQPQMASLKAISYQLSAVSGQPERSHQHFSPLRGPLMESNCVTFTKRNMQASRHA
jgi:hypothetical protein